MASRTADALRRYYEYNTGLFLHLSGGRSTHSLHRPVWGETVSTYDEAFTYPYRLVLQTVRDVASSPRITSDSAPHPDRPLRTLDLGCGVGGGVHFLLDHVDRPLRGIGITLSPTQVERARQQARRKGFPEDRYTFLEADFHDMPVQIPVDVAFAIEAFVLAVRPELFFEEVSSILRPGGRLVVIDDFFADPASERHLSRTEQKWVETVRAGWHAYSLCSASAAQEVADAHDLRLVTSDNLTSSLAFDRLRDRLINWAVVPFRPLLWRWPYFRGLIGGDALQKCLKAGIIEYRHLVFERRGDGRT